MLIDLHAHTHPGSWDSFLTPDEYIDLSKQAGLDAVVLTEHDWAWDHEAVRSLARRHDLLVLAGMEINTEDGHVLVFGMHRYVYGMHRIRELAEHVQRDDGVMVAAHPYRRQHPWNWDSQQEWQDALRRASVNAMFRYVAGIEVANGRGKPEENGFSLAIADMLGFSRTAANDSHAVADIGKTATYFEADIRNEADLVAALRSGRYWPLDRTRGKVIVDPAYHDVPPDVHARWSDLAERQRRFLAGESPSK